MYNISRGITNTVFGYNALFNITTGSSNTAIGNQSLRDNDFGFSNTAVGSSSLLSNTSGTGNTTIGNQTLLFNKTGSNNIAIGLGASIYTNVGIGATNSNTSIFIGVDTKPQLDNQSNQIVIGYGATGNGSNSVTLGNNSIIRTYLKGKVVIADGSQGSGKVLHSDINGLSTWIAPTLAEGADVIVGGMVAGDLLTWDSLGVWTNYSIGYVITNYLGYTPANDATFIWNKFMINETSWFLPGNGNTTYDTLRVRSAGLVQLANSIAQGGIFPDAIQYTSAATVGAVAAVYGSSIDVNPSLLYDFLYQRRFRITINIGVQRFFCGISMRNPTGTPPTNVDPLTLINSIGVAKIDTSPNLFFCYNDGAGSATLVDLGSSYLAFTTSYNYTLTIQKPRADPQIYMSLLRTEIATGATISTSAILISTDYNNNVHYPVIWITNNTTATGARFLDFGCIVQKSARY